MRRGQQGREIWSRLVCPNCKQVGPNCKQVGLRLSTSAVWDGEGLPEYGYAVCDNCKRLYPIAEGILDMARYEARPGLTIAGWSNHFSPTPQLYERIWRRRALTLMTGESYPVERELNLLHEWMGVQAGETVVDLGTSTGVYARGVATKGATIFAVDLAWGMLREAKGYIARDRAKGIVLMRAAAEKLPFEDGSVDAVVVGGSFNEMKSIPTALREAQRVTREGGRMFVMSLSESTKSSVHLLQAFLSTGGIQFPSVNEFNAMTAGAGWKTEKQELRGIVLFTLLTK